MKKYILSILTVLICNNLLCQVFQDIDETVSSLKSTTTDLLNYYDISNEPIKYVRVNMIFLRKNDGTGGFQSNNSAHQQYINDKINNSNYFMANITSDYDTICYDGSSGVINDSKIRFVYNVMYINNSTAWNNGGGGCSVLPSNLVTLNDSIVQNSAYPAINMFYTEDQTSYQNIVINQNCPTTNNIPNTSCTYRPSFYSFNDAQNVHMRCSYTKYYWMMNCVVGNSYWGYPSQSTVYSWLNAGRVEAHELVHNLDLGDIDKPNGECDQHLRMHNHDGYGNFLSPEEIADMHKALSQSNARRFVTETTYSSTPITISQNTSWASSIRIYRGLTIQSGAAFQLSSELIIPSETDIVVTGSGSSFTASGATIHTPHTNSTLDMIVQQSASATLSDGTTIQNCNVSVQSGSLTINNANIDISSTGSFNVAVGATFTMSQGSIY
ncbi:MAG TPA: hypothetical protein PKH79_10860 [Prolixibacteraceae bacterium]|nr:hypothetical protein [Prolixibacteraceae bacterium]